VVAVEQAASGADLPGLFGLSRNRIEADGEAHGLLGNHHPPVRQRDAELVGRQGRKQFALSADVPAPVAWADPGFGESSVCESMRADRSVEGIGGRFGRRRAQGIENQGIQGPSLLPAKPCFVLELDSDGAGRESDFVLSSGNAEALGPIGLDDDESTSGMQQLEALLPETLDPRCQVSPGFGAAAVAQSPRHFVRIDRDLEISKDHLWDEISRASRVAWR